jgi:murein DD-endopeptidase MepM/ murein hydrolase activator NlpD
LTQRFWRYHPGVDLAVDVGTPVRATHSGLVIFAGWRWDGYGNLVIVQNGRFITYYGHNHALLVASGQIVHTGDILALSGSTGWSSGPHVHYETHIDNAPVDPMTFDARQLRSC